MTDFVGLASLMMPLDACLLSSRALMIPHEDSKYGLHLFARVPFKSNQPCVKSDFDGPAKFQAGCGLGWSRHLHMEIISYIQPIRNTHGYKA